jgi:hypothetical protein
MQTARLANDVTENAVELVKLYLGRLHMLERSDLVGRQADRRPQFRTRSNSLIQLSETLWHLLEGLSL